MVKFLFNDIVYTSYEEAMEAVIEDNPGVVPDDYPDVFDNLVEDVD